MKPIPVGTLVDYHHGGRYVVTQHHCAHDMFPRNEWDEVKDYYPDGIAYEILPEGMPYKLCNALDFGVFRVRRSSLTVVSCTREGFEPMDPFTEEI
jgi:hypothetical protein